MNNLEKKIADRLLIFTSFSFECKDCMKAVKSIIKLIEKEKEKAVNEALQEVSK